MSSSPSTQSALTFPTSSVLVFSSDLLESCTIEAVHTSEMERGFGTFGIGTTLPDRSRVLERLGQRSDRTNVGSFSQDSKTRPNSFAKESKPALSVHYTISEDRCGTEEEIKGKILANLQPKCEGPIDQLSEFIVALGGEVTDEVEELLRSNRGVINREDEDGDTPIHTAVRTGKLEVLQHLIALGATVYHRNDAARTPLFLAARLGMYSQASLLRQAGAQLHNEELEEARFLAERDPEIWRVAGLEAAPVMQQPTSYWSVPEQMKFPQLIAYFGSDFTASADFMKTKTATMVRFYLLNLRVGFH